MSPLWCQFLGVIIGADQLRSPRELEAVRQLGATAEQEREVERGALMSRDSAARAALMRQLAGSPQEEVIEGLDQAWRVAASDGVPNTRELELIRALALDAFGPHRVELVIEYLRSAHQAREALRRLGLSA